MKSRPCLVVACLLIGLASPLTAGASGLSDEAQAPCGYVLLAAAQPNDCSGACADSLKKCVPACPGLTPKGLPDPDKPNVYSACRSKCYSTFEACKAACPSTKK